MVTQAEIAPDGQNIAYVLSVPRKLFDENDGPAWAELHVVDREGRSRPFLAGQVNVSAVDWTPDGRRISFLAKRRDDKEDALYVIALAGGEARAAVRRETAIAHYAWSPDGRRVAFTAPRPKTKEQRELESKGFTQEIFEEDHRPDELWVADLDEEGLAKEPKKVELNGSATTMAWRPDSKRLAVVLAPSPSVDDSYMNRRIVIVDPDNGEIHGGYQPPGKMGPFQWSPDGERLAVVSTLDRSDPSPGRIVVATAGGQDVRTLLPDYAGHVQALEWLSNDRIAYVADEGVQSTLASVAVSGEDTRTRIGVSDKQVFSWVSMADNGAMALIAESPSHPPEAYLLEQEGSGPPRRLTTSNPWIQEKPFAKQEAVRFRARDGLLIEGVLIRPLNEEAGRRYPLILYVHGGPESRESNGWLTSYVRPGQVAAAQGFAVFYPNYRASTGRGVEFSKLDHGDPAGKEFDDLVDAAQHLASTGLADPKKVGVTGASYGGYATAWAATALSEHFAAGVMFVGIADQISQVGTTEIPDEMFEVHNRSRPWDHWNLFLERSPIYHAEKGRTPLLILHGKADTRVPTSQSVELYRALETLGNAPVRLVLYPGEGHGNRRAASRYDYNLRMLRWFEHYLKGPGGDPPPYALPVKP